MITAERSRRRNSHIALPLAALFSLLLSACGSSGETLVVTQRPEPGYVVPSDTLEVDDRSTTTAGLDTVDVGEFPGGRMWPFDDVPFEHFQERYGIEVDTQWVNRVRLSTLRLPNCTASFVSES